MSFNEDRARKVIEIEAVLNEMRPDPEGLAKTVMKAMNYSLMAGGKRLRPMLIAETYRFFGGEDMTVTAPFMAAIEMIHTYSLIHDDLPALDNDDYRRGRLTNHKVFGEAMAILAGDGLLNYAYETASKAFDAAKDYETLSRTAKAMQILAHKPGIYGMIGGQTADVELEGQSFGQDVLSFIHENKTSALIECSMMIGAVLAGADEAQIADIERAAKLIGISFQVQDDILDVTGDEALLGKPLHSDEKNEKTTYVTLYGLEGAMKEAQRLSDEAMAILTKTASENDRKNPFLFELIESLVHRDR